MRELTDEERELVQRIIVTGVATALGVLSVYLNRLGAKSRVENERIRNDYELYKFTGSERQDSGCSHNRVYGDSDRKVCLDCGEEVVFE